MKTTLSITCIAAALLLVPASIEARERSLDDLRTELEALTQSVSAQMKLLSIYEDLGKTREAAAARKRVLEMVASYRTLLDEITTRMGGKAPGSFKIDGVAGGSVRVGVHIPSEKRWELAAKGSVGMAVYRGLRWLARHQDPDGLWDCDGFMKLDLETPICDGPGRPLFDPGVTGLALLAFLRVGETHKDGAFRETVRRGLKYLKQVQDPEGCFGPRTSNHFIYSHAIATLAMAEAYGRTKSPLFKQSAQLGVDFIHKCQNPYLAWRYGVRPGDNDTSVTGWCVEALAVAKKAGLRVDPVCFDGAKAWIEKATEPEYGRVGYTSRGSGPARPQDLMDKFPADKSESLTAEGICIRLSVGEDPKQSDPIAKGADLVLKVLPQWDEGSGDIDMYYWFWGTEATSRIGSLVWRKWAQSLEGAVRPNQREGGAFDGSWDPLGPWGREGGRVYSTALMVMVLERVAQTPVARRAR